jgi:hypothetical protein
MKIVSFYILFNDLGVFFLFAPNWLGQAVQ